MKTANKVLSAASTIMVIGMLTLSNQAYGQNRPQGEQREPPTYAKLLEEMDSNKDGKLGKSEVKGPLKDDFSKIDTNEDGVISEEEFKKAPKPEKGQRPPRKN